MISFNKILQILKKELYQTFRNPRLVVLLFLPPIIQLVVFGYAVNFDVKNIKTAIIDYDRTPASRDFIAHIESNKYFKTVKYLNNSDQIKHEIDSSAISCAIVISNGFMKNIENGKTAVVQAVHDGIDSNNAITVNNYLNMISYKYLKKIQVSKIEKINQKLAASGRAPIKINAIVIEPRAWFNQSLESKDFFVPGIIGNILMLITVMLTSMAIVREKEIGTIEQLLVTPIRPLEIIIGKTLPFMLIGIVQASIIVVAAVLWFEIPVRGSYALLFCGVVIYLLSNLGIGIFISTVSQTQQQAMLVTTFFMLPAFTLSGFVFPIVNMPEIVQYLTFLIPLRYFLIIVRGVFLKGVGMEVLFPQYAAMTIISLAILAFSVMKFRRTID
ncbi:MAG TPA: ABC transporter permease [Candidatus Wallbacteria bacterium]|nr:ABC transporter permease [Candidatus Wallbacteria bacterium]